MNHRATALTAALGLASLTGVLVATSGADGAAARALEPAAAVSSEAEPSPGRVPVEAKDEPAGGEAARDEPSLPEDLTQTRETGPDRTVLYDADGQWVATFTDGASTVALAGPSRRFDEDSADHGVTSTTWVRVLPEPFDGEVDMDWLEAAREDRSPDVLEVSTEYWTGAPDVVDDDGVLISADSGYGPLQPDGSRPIGSDWHDFQGVEGIYDDEIDPPDPEEYRHLDCSGYVRILYGVRFGLPMTLWPDDGASLPRRSRHQASSAPGVVPIENRGEQVDPEAFGRLQPGDLVFFDAPSDDDGRIDHVGIYLGVDDGGHHRFVHSRRSTNGPTMGGDDKGASTLDGDGFFSEGFRSTRRL